MLFTDLPLVQPLLRAIEEEGYTSPSPIQEQAIPHVVAGRDLLGIAQTGTGKTAAFSLPLLQRLMETKPQGVRPIRGLILTPTRELAAQIAESLSSYGRHANITHTVIFGGVGQNPQEKALKRGVDIVVATPGRFLDLMSQGFVKLDKVEVFILDEADRMLDMGFVHDVKKVIAKLPQKRQTLLFSATMPPEITSLSSQILIDPIRVEVTPASSTVEKIKQSIYFVEKAQKRNLLVHLMEDKKDITRAIVFTRTKHGANRVAELLEKSGIEAAAIHGNKSQSARERALGRFRDGSLRVLVATDIAARGIDVDAISHVINFDLPNVPEQYVHRIGRTARAGAEGLALSFCEAEERPYLIDIERLTQQHLPVVTEHPWPSNLPLPIPTDLDPKSPVRRAPVRIAALEGHGQRRSHSRPSPRQTQGPRGAVQAPRATAPRSAKPSGNTNHPAVPGETRAPRREAPARTDGGAGAPRSEGRRPSGGGRPGGRGRSGPSR